VDGVNTFKKVELKVEGTLLFEYLGALMTL